jgi:hypothetical protein
MDKKFTIMISIALVFAIAAVALQALEILAYDMF